MEIDLQQNPTTDGHDRFPQELSFPYRYCCSAVPRVSTRIYTARGTYFFLLLRGERELLYLHVGENRRAVKMPNPYEYHGREK